MHFFFRLDLGSILFIWFVLDWMVAAVFVSGIEMSLYGRTLLEWGRLALAEWALAQQPV